MKKTAEHVLNLHIDDLDDNYTSKESCIKAMKEYASQFHPTPTEAEINEAAERYAHDRTFPVKGVEYAFSLLQQMKAEKAWAKENWLNAIQWLQNYQTQGREKQEHETVEAAAVARLKDDAKSLLSRGSLKNDERSQTIYILGAKFGANWHASQPNPAIAVIEVRIVEVKKQIEQWPSNLSDHGLHSRLNELETLKETILKQIKP